MGSCDTLRVLQGIKKGQFVYFSSLDCCDLEPNVAKSGSVFNRIKNEILFFEILALLSHKRTNSSENKSRKKENINTT